jgi:hypothetical protein
MKRHGFEVHSDDPLNPLPVEDDSQLSKHARAAGIAFASRLAINAVGNYFVAASNREQFNRAMGQRTREALLEIGCGVTFDLVLHYGKLPTQQGVDRMLDLDIPGDGDVFNIVLRELSTQIPGKSVGFQRRGVNGFDLIVVPLAEQTVLGIKGAADKYGW